MRVATSQIYSIANIGMRDALAAATKTQTQLSSGKRILSPADDPVAATQILQLQQEVKSTEQFNKNIDAATTKLNLEEVSIDGVVSLVQRMQEIGVRAGNTAVLTASDYKNMAAEVDSRIQELQNLQNTKDASGQYIFAGYQSDNPPFVRGDTGAYQYQGDQGELSLQVSHSVSIQVNDSGDKLFQVVPSSHNTFRTQIGEANTSNAQISLGTISDQNALDDIMPQDITVTYNTGTPNTLSLVSTDGTTVNKTVPFTTGQAVTVAGMSFSLKGQPANGDEFTLHTTNKQSLLDTMSRFSAALKAVKDNSQSKQAMAEVAGRTLGNLDKAVTHITSVQSEVGARLNTLENSKSLNADHILYTQKVQSSLEDVDVAAASTRLKMQSLVLTAAQKSFSQVSQLSLFNYL